MFDYEKYERFFNMKILPKIPDYRIVYCNKCGALYFSCDGCPYCSRRK